MSNLRIRRFLATAMLLLLSSFSGGVMAADAWQQFREFAATFRAATGKFVQYTVGSQGQTQMAQQGAFSFQRPGQFRWDVQQPYSQLVLSSGKLLYQYDPDLRQVTVRPVGASIGSSPAAILFGDADLEESFRVQAIPDQDGMAWFRAIPHQPDAGLNQLDIGMSQGKPARLLLRDSFGQTTRIDLSDLRAQSEFPAGTFRFDPPPGTDVVKLP